MGIEEYSEGKDPIKELEKLEDYGKIKKEYDEFRRLRRDLGLKDFKLININQMKKNLEKMGSLLD